MTTLKYDPTSPMDALRIFRQLAVGNETARHVEQLLAMPEKEQKELFAYMLMNNAMMLNAMVAGQDVTPINKDDMN